MKKHQTYIKCKEKIVALTTPKGERISVDVAVQAPPTATMNQLDDVDTQLRILSKNMNK